MTLYNNKWHPSVMVDVEYFIEHSRNLTMTELAKYLGVSRQTLYNWCIYYPNFKLLVQTMKHQEIFKMPMWGDAKRNAEHFKDL